MLKWFLDFGWIVLAVLWVLCAVLVFAVFASDLECDCCMRRWAIFTRQHPGMAIPLHVCRKCAKHFDRRQAHPEHRTRVRVVR